MAQAHIRFFYRENGKGKRRPIMRSIKRSKNHLTTLMKYVVLLCIFAILGSTAACSLPFKIVPNTQEEGPPPEEHWEEGEPPPEEHMPGEEPPPEPPPGEEPPPDPPPGEPPPPPPPPPAPPSGGGGGAFTADVAVTDIFPDKMPHGQFHVRITNHGPGTLNNVTVPVVCQYERTDKNNKSQSAQGATISVKLGIAPGEQMSFPTTLNLDTDVFEYLIACEVLPNFDDPNPGNNVYNESIK